MEYSKNHIPAGIPQTDVCGISVRSSMRIAMPAFDQHREVTRHALGNGGKVL
ncbi:MAG TPA: hypothetical protein VMP11_10685 [Verrucomicrobiae bacterium]|nr:hypothetical protein [Verrucomicrobiae bacterium]